jgi:hypothetical protein
MFLPVFAQRICAHLTDPCLADLCGKKSGPNLFHQNRTVSWLISMPRSCKRSSTFRSESGNRTYIITARRISALYVECRFRPFAAFRRTVSMLQCGPPKETFVHHAVFCRLKSRSAGQTGSWPRHEQWLLSIGGLPSPINSPRCDTLALLLAGRAMGE